MSYSLSPLLKPRFFVNSTNKPLVGGKLYTYLAETTTPLATYSDDAGTPNTNPIILDANGECNLYLDDDKVYRLILKDANDNTYFDKDRVSSIGGGDFSILTFNNVADLRLKIGSEKEPAANTSGYYAAGDGGGNSFYWDDTSSAVDNGGTIIKPTFVSGSGRWLATNRDSINVRQFGAYGDGSTDDTSAIVKAIDEAINSVVFPAGVYVHTAITISKRMMFLGIRGKKLAANVWPRLFLKSGTNADGITITTTGALYADKMDFWGNKNGQSAESSIIVLDELAGDYVGGNSLFFTDCVIREGYTNGIKCNKNRNGGRLINCSIYKCNADNFVLYGEDWYCVSSEFGEAGGANLYTNFGASNDFVMCDFFYSGKNAAHVGSKSNIYIGSAVNCITISNCQINSAYHHGIECIESGAAAQYIITGNQFGASGVETANTYSNIKIGFNRAAIKGNVHWNVGQKPKYLIETYGTAVRVDFDDIYPTDSYVTAFTNDETKLFNRSTRDGISLGDGGAFISRTSANDKRLKFFDNTDANERFSVDNNGTLRWGAGGASSPDVALLRTTANVLEVASDDCLKTGRNSTANRPNAAIVGAGSMFYDTTLGKPIWSNGSVWKDAAGTAV